MRKKRLLILNQNGIGDILIRFPACRWLCSKPEFDIWMAVRGQTEIELCTNERLGSQFISLNRTSTKQLIKNIITLRRLKIDTVIGWWSFSIRKVAFFSRIIGARHFICPPSKECDYYDRKSLHKSQRNLFVASSFLEEPIPESRAGDYYFDNIDISIDKQMIGTHQYIVIFPGSGRTEKFKRWPMPEWIKFCDLFIARNPGSKILISGSISESVLAEEIIKNVSCKDNCAIKNFCGKIPIRQVAGICKNAKFVIGGDNGGLHIANASGAKVIAIMGPTNSALTGPINPILIIDKKLPGTPWYSNSSKRKRRNNNPDISMQIPAETVINELARLNLG
jgi:ADP-heptose:LPS heptosyltransferase